MIYTREDPNGSTPVSKRTRAQATVGTLMCLVSHICIFICVVALYNKFVHQFFCIVSKKASKLKIGNPSYCLECYTMPSLVVYFIYKSYLTRQLSLHAYII